MKLAGTTALVTGDYAGYIDTDMTTGVAGPKSSPTAIAAGVIEGIEDGTEDRLADQRSREVFDMLRKDDRGFDANMQKLWDKAN